MTRTGMQRRGEKEAVVKVALSEAIGTGKWLTVDRRIDSTTSPSSPTLYHFKMSPTPLIAAGHALHPLHVQ